MKNEHEVTAASGQTGALPPSSDDRQAVAQSVRY
ncbi:Uncharacterised protein [Shigella sonnei]|nr:Uncharacterised protein [Shigella sonnei]